MIEDKMNSYFEDWRRREELAESMIPLVGGLYRDHGVVTTIYGRSLINKSTIGILKAHRFTRKILSQELSIASTKSVLEAIFRADLTPARIDLGKLTAKFELNSNGVDVDAFVNRELAAMKTLVQPTGERPQDVVLYGFGRIGRMIARILIERSGGADKWRLRAIVVQSRKNDSLLKRASLLRRDSVHGQFYGTITVDTDENAIVANGNMIRVIYADGPENVDYTRYDISEAIIIDNTGGWRDRKGLSRHLLGNGVAKVILTAPGKGDIPNIVYGVNNGSIREDENLFSAGSCTTNAIVPVLKALNDRFGVESGHIETCHSYTNDQNLTDNFHRYSRRGRAAPLNMVITETGAAEAVGKVLPDLDGRLTANAIRVPTPNVSLAILSLNLSSEVTVDQVNSYLRDISLDSPLQGQIDYVSSPEVVSSDFIGNMKAGVVDSLATIVQGRRCNIYVWYDNEFGYSVQVVRILQHISNLELPSFPRV